jgi:hypothetical protein
MRRVVFEIMGVCVIACLIIILVTGNGVSRTRTSPDVDTLKELAVLEERCSKGIESHSNLYIASRLYRAGKQYIPRPMAIGAELISVLYRPEDSLMLYAYNPERDIESYSVLFRKRDGQLCEIRKLVSPIDSDIVMRHSFVRRAPLSSFDEYVSGDIVDVGETVTLPSDTEMSVAFSTSNGAMSNAVMIRAVIGGHHTN